MNKAQGNTERFEIDPRQFKRDRGYIGCLVVWCVLMMALITIFYFYQFWPGLFGGALMLSVAVPLAFLQRNKVDTLIASEDGLLVVKNRRYASAIFIRRANQIGLTLECVTKGAWDDGESVATLNLWDNISGCRHVLGLWVDQESKQELFMALKDFLEGHGFDVVARNDIAKKKQNKELHPTAGNAPI